MIVKLKFEPEGEKSFYIMTGDSYKDWNEQHSEMKNCSWYENLTEIWKSEVDDWIGWGGLKWCSEESFQEELNREGVQFGEPDNPNARQYSEMKGNFKLYSKF